MTFREKFSSFWHNPRNLFLVSLLLTLTIVLMEFLHEGMENHIVYRDATINFFNGVSSYTPEFAESHHRYFLYLPVFHFLYAPFAFLPLAIGGLLWNLFCYCLFFVCIMNLPRLDEQKRSSVFLLMLPFLGQSLFCFQFNTIVCCIFLLAYILLERGNYFWAVLLIALSASIKVYGVIQLALLLCYPKFWRNLGYSVLCIIGLMLIPAIKTGFSGLIPWYMNWADCLMNHSDATGPYFSLIWAWPLHDFAMSNLRLFQIAVLAILAVLFFVCHKRWQEPDFRIGALATLVIYIIIMSEATEYCTYIIPASVIMLWYISRDKANTTFDKILLWAFFILFGLVPIDLFCPSVAARFIHTKLWLGVWMFVVLWGRIIYTTVKPTFSND